MAENLTGAEWYDQTWREIKAANPDWEDQQVYDEMTRRMGEADWNARYQNVMADIANSSTPAEREQKINYYQAELASFKDSGIDVDNDIEYLRVTQGAATVSVTEKIGSVFNDLYDGAKSSLASVVAHIAEYENGPISTAENNIGLEAVQGITTNSIEAQYTIAPDDPAFLDARLSLEDIRNGYRLQYNPNGILWRVNLANMPHPYDLRNFYRQQEYNQAQLEQETESGIRALSQIKELLVQGASKASAGQKALLSAKVQEWARGMEFLGTGYSAGGLVPKGAAIAEKVMQGSSKAAEKLGQVVKTDYGPAVQSTEGEALKLREYVDSGGNLYKAGTFGRSNAADSQFWASENPLTTPGYANKYGVDFSKVDYIIGGKIKGPYITRPAPGLGKNAGGALEVVTDPFGVELDFFYMP